MKNCLLYREPATSWEKGMPLGNGRIGAMLLGETAQERIWLNEDTLWSGYPTDYTDAEAFPYLQKAREAIFQERYQEADELINQHLVGIWNESYLPMADLYLDMKELEEGCSSYQRTLDIRESIQRTSLVKNGVQYQRTSFCSFPDQVFAMQIRADRPFSGSLNIRLDSQMRHWTEWDGEILMLKGWCPTVVEPSYYPAEDPIRYDSYEETPAIKFGVGLKVITDGKVCGIQEGLVITETSEVCLLLTSKNSFRGFSQAPDAPYEEALRECLERAGRRDFSELLERHRKDVTELFDRVEIDLGHTENERLPMKERLRRLEQGEDDPELLATAFQFGRYLLIAGSREGSQPLNLQGIWNGELRAPWSSNYTVNINTQMNYWPVEVCNLPECAEPLVTFLEETAKSGRKTASVNYHCRGWAAHHNIDLWRKTTAVGSRKKEVPVMPWSFWVMSGGWLCRHLWEHYQYTKDLTFLRETAFPILKASAEFYLDWLVEWEGHLVSVPSTSPENLFLTEEGPHGGSYSCTMDISILKELFGNCLNAIEELAISDEEAFREEIEQALPRLHGFQIGTYGQLQEWVKDFPEQDPKHRHLSHLYGLYPSDLITVEKTPKLAKACAVTLERRGEESVAWSRAWKISLFARLKDGERAGTELVKFLQYADSNEISYDDGGIYENLFCARPFQIDGCLGFTAGMAEMLVQSHGGEVQWLPAIPKSWKDGYVRGLKVRGNQTVTAEWKDGKILRKELT